MLRRSARLKQKKQDEQLKWERWFAVQRWAKKREKTPPHAYLDLPCPDSELLFATNSPRQPDNAHHVWEKSVMERCAKCSDEPHDYRLSQSKTTAGNSAHMGTAFQMSDHGKLLSHMDKLKQKSSLLGVSSTTVSALQHEKNLLGNSDLTHKKQPIPKKLLENSCSEGKCTPHPGGPLHSPVGQSPRPNPAGNRTPVVLVQKLPKFCQLGSPVSVSSLSRMNSPAESLGRADLPMITMSSFEKSCEGDGFVSQDGSSIRNFSCTEICSSTCIDYHGYHASETSYCGTQDKTDMTQIYSSTSSLVLTSLELAANEGIDDQCFNSMLETCAQMTRVCQNDNRVVVKKSPLGVQDRHTSHLQTVGEPWSSADIVDLSGQDVMETSVKHLLNQNPTCSVTQPASLGSCQGTVESSMRKEPAVSEACSASYKNMGTGKKVRGRKKRCLSQDAPSVKSTVYGSGKQSLEYGVTKMEARKGQVKMLKEKKKQKGYMYKCRHCSFCSKDKAAKEDHVKNCHLNCRSYDHRSPDSEIFKGHKAVCDVENYRKCFLCVRSFRKKHTKRHFHSQSHQRIVLLLKKAALHIQHHGNIYGLLSSITCDVSSGCETCHSTSLNMEEPEDDGFAEKRTAVLADTSLHSDPHHNSSSTSLPESQHSQGVVFLADAPLGNSQCVPASSLHQLSRQGQARTGGPEAEPVTECSGSVLCEGTHVSSASETAGSRPVLSGVGPSAQKEGDDTFIDLIDFLDEYDLSAVGMEEDSGVDLDVLTAGNCSDSSLVQCGQNLTEQTPDQSVVCSRSCQDLCGGTGKGVPDNGAATDTVIVVDPEVHWPPAVQPSALPYITASDPTSENNGRTWAGTFQNIPCPTYGYSDVRADCSQDTKVSAVEQLHMSVSPISSGCKTLGSTDCGVVGDVPENSSTQHQGNRNDAWPSECSYPSERGFPGIISSVTVPGVTGFQEQTQPQGNTANQSPAEQPAVGPFVVNLAAVKPNTVPHTADYTTQDSGRTSALPLASLTGPPGREASVIPNVEWSKGSAATSSNAPTFVVDLRYCELPESSMPKRTDDTTLAVTHSISVPQNPTERASEGDSRNASSHAAESDSQCPQSKNSQQGSGAERQLVKVSRVGRPRKRGRKKKTDPLSPKRPKLAETTTCPEEDVSGERCGLVRPPAVWQTADTDAPPVNTGSEHTRPGFGATTATKEAKINSGKQVSVIQSVSEHRITSSSASKPSEVSTSTSKQPAVSTSTSKQPAVSTSTSNQPVVSTSPSKQPVVSTSTSKQPVVSTSTSKQPAVSTSTSKQPLVSTSTSKQPAVSTSTSKQPVVSTSTSKQPVVSTSTSKQPVVSTSTSKQPAVSTSTSKQPAVNTSTSKQPAVNTSTLKQPAVNTSTLKQTAVNTSTLKQPAVNTSTLKQPAVNTSTLKQPAVNTSTLKQPAVNTSTSKQPAVNTSTSKQPAVNTSTSKQPAVNTSTSKQPAVNTSTSKQPAVSTSTSKQPLVNTSTSKQPLVSPSTSKQPLVNTSTLKQPLLNTSTLKQSAVNTSTLKQLAVNTSKQPVGSTSTSKQPLSSTSKPLVSTSTSKQVGSTSKQPLVSTSTSKQVLTKPAVSTSTSKQPVGSTSKQLVGSTSTSKQVLTKPAVSTSTSQQPVGSTSKQPLVNPSMSKQPVVSTSASKQPLGSTSKQPVKIASTSKQPLVNTLTSKQPVGSTSTSKQPVVSTSKQPVVSTSTSKQPVVSTSTSKQPLVSSLTSKQSVVSTSSKQVVSTSTSKQPVVSTSTSKQPVVSTSTSKQPVVSTSKQPVGSTSTSKQPVVSTSKQPVVSTSKQPVVSTSKQPVGSTSKQPVVSTSKQPVVSTSKQSLVSTSKQPVVSTSTTKQPVVSTSKQPVVSTSTTKQPVVSTSKQPVGSTSKQPVVSTSKQPVVSTSTSKQPLVSTSRQPVVSTSTSKQPVVSTSKQPLVSTSTSKQPLVSTSTSKQPLVSTSTSKQPVVSTSKQPVKSTSASKQPFVITSKQPVVSTSTSKQLVGSTSTSKQLVGSTSTSKQPVKSSCKVTPTCSTLQPKVTPTCSTLQPKVTPTCSSLQPIVTPTCSTLQPKVTPTCSTLQPIVTPTCSTLQPIVTPTCSTLQPIVTPTCSTLMPVHRTTPLQTTSVSEQATVAPGNGAVILNRVVQSNAMVPSVLCLPEPRFAVQQNGGEAVRNIVMCQYLPSGPWGFNTFHSPMLSFRDLCRPQPLSVSEVEVDIASISQPVRAHSSERQTNHSE